MRGRRAASKGGGVCVGARPGPPAPPSAHTACVCAYVCVKTRSPSSSQHSYHQHHPLPGSQPDSRVVPPTASHTGLFFQERWSVNHRPQMRSVNWWDGHSCAQVSCSAQHPGWPENNTEGRSRWWAGSVHSYHFVQGSHSGPAAPENLLRAWGQGHEWVRGRLLKIARALKDSEGLEGTCPCWQASGGSFRSWCNAQWFLLGSGSQPATQWTQLHLGAAESSIRWSPAVPHLRILLLLYMKEQEKIPSPTRPIAKWCYQGTSVLRRCVVLFLSHPGNIRISVWQRYRKRRQRLIHPCSGKHRTEAEEKARSKQTFILKDVSTEDSGEQGGTSISHPHCSAQKDRGRIQAYSSHLSRNQLLSMATCFHYFCNYSTNSSKHITCTGDSKRTSFSLSP